MYGSPQVSILVTDSTPQKDIGAGLTATFYCTLTDGNGDYVLPDIVSFQAASVGAGLVFTSALGLDNTTTPAKTPATITVTNEGAAPAVDVTVTCVRFNRPSVSAAVADKQNGLVPQPWI